MKKLIMSLILAVILTVTLVTPAFAWGPGDMPDGAKKGLERATEFEYDEYIQSIYTGLIAPWYYGHNPNGYAIGPLQALKVILYTLLGN